jgi:hypothetical protein
MKMLRLLSVMLFAVLLMSCSDNDDSNSGSISIDGKKFKIKEAHVFKGDGNESDSSLYYVWFISEGISYGLVENNVMYPLKGKGAVGFIMFAANDASVLPVGSSFEAFSFVMDVRSFGKEGEETDADAYEIAVDNLTIKKSDGGFSFNMKGKDDDTAISISYKGKFGDKVIGL